MINQTFNSYYLEMEYKGRKYSSLDDVYKAIQLENERLSMETIYLEKVNSELCKEIKEVREENKKLKDEFMLKLAEAYLLPPTSNQMVEYKKWNFSKWYDVIKNKMRKEIEGED